MSSRRNISSRPTHDTGSDPYLVDEGVISRIYRLAHDTGYNTQGAVVTL